jgi:CelD/BcsL family acetyltransferase involved in cellulose biosynthesis
MLTAETYHPAELDDLDVAAWRRLAAGQHDFANPLVGPDFARAVGAVREDARVSVWRADGHPVGFLAYHSRPGGFARPIGAPFSDYHALVAEPGLDSSQALAAAGIAAYRFTNLIDPAGAFQSAVTSQAEAFVIHLESSAEVYLETLRAASPKRFKNYRRLDHKLDREVGELRIVAPDVKPAAFAQLLTWKREQLARTGLHDVLGPAWARQLMCDLFETHERPFAGLMINLYAGDRLVAGHFGVRAGGVFHPWIASADPALAEWSPGQIFLSRAIAAMPDLALDTYDLGSSHEHYKRPYALHTRVVSAGLVTAATPQGRTAQLSDRAWALAEALGPAPVGRLRRRIDAIAAAELSLAARVKGLAMAIAARAMPRESV